MSSVDALSDLQDQGYENEVSRNPYSLKSWLKYLDFKKEASCAVRFKLFERSLKYLPRSYKLWHLYLKEKAHKVRNLCITNKKYDALTKLYEKCLVHLHKMPVIW